MLTRVPTALSTPSQHTGASAGTAGTLLQDSVVKERDAAQQGGATSFLLDEEAGVCAHVCVDCMAVTISAGSSTLELGSDWELEVTHQSQ